MGPQTPFLLNDFTLDDLVRRACEAPLAEDEERRLEAGVAGGDAEARDALVLAHVKDVVDEAIAQRGGGVAVQTLIRRGLAALVRASETYDPVRDGEFAGYARPLIRRDVRSGALHH